MKKQWKFYMQMSSRNFCGANIAATLPPGTFPGKNIIETIRGINKTL